MTLYEYETKQQTDKQDFQHFGWVTFWAICLIVTLYLLGLCVGLAGASEVDLDIIKQIESSGNRWAVSCKGARGLHQITECVLHEYNVRFKTKYTLKDLHNPEVSQKIASWYFDRIDEMLHFYGYKQTINNRLICYNAGIGVLVSEKGIPQETVNYIKKYKKLSKRQVRK